MKKLLTIALTLFIILGTAHPAYAQTTGDVTQIQNFIQNLIQLIAGLAGLIAAGFFVVGGFGYITSSGNPESLDRSKKTIIYSAIGLAIVLGAFVLSNIVSQLATSSFGA